jgi:hypothetical protein
MFGLTDIFEKLSQAFGGGQLSELAGQALQAGSITDLLANAGIDPALLDGLNQEELMGLLANAGIDPAALTEGQLGELAALIPGGSGLADIAQNLTSGFGGRG